MRTLLLALAVFGVFASAFAQALSETAVRAAFIFNFGKFVEWPVGLVEGREKFSICYVGAVGPLFRELVKLEDKKVQNKPIDVPRVSNSSEIRQCAILVFGEAEARVSRRELLRAAEEANVLTVGDAEGFASAGGAIGLLTSGDRVSFEINLDSARAANLRIPAQLARLGRVVTPGKQP